MIFAVIKNGRNIKGKQFTAEYTGVYRVTECTGQKKTAPAIYFRNICLTTSFFAVNFDTFSIKHKVVRLLL